MARRYQLTLDELDAIYNKVKMYGVTKENIKQLTQNTIKVKKGQCFFPPSDCLCLLLDGAFYSFEEKNDSKGIKSKQINCLISNNIYGFLFTPVEYCDEMIISKLSLPGNVKCDIQETRKIKASVDSIVIMINISVLKKVNLSALVSAYYTHYSIKSKQMHKILQFENATEKKIYIIDNFKKIREEYNENIISNFFGIKYDTWKHIKL